MYKTIGIIGGMGPKATCDLMEKIIASTYAENDQEHIHICVDCNTNIPDRTKAIVDHGKNPIPEMVKSGMQHVIEICIPDIMGYDDYRRYY